MGALITITRWVRIVHKVAVTVHNCFRHGDVQSIELRPVRIGDSAAVVLSGFAGHDASTLLDSFMEHTQQQDLQYAIEAEGLDTGSSILAVTALVHAGAFPDSDKILQVDPADILRSPWAALISANLASRAMHRVPN